MFLRNQIDLGRAYKGRYVSCKYPIDFDYAKRELEAASKTALRTGNFVYAGRALRYLGELYETVNERGEAIKNYLRCLEMFSEEGYPAYHEKIVNELYKLVWTDGRGLPNPSIRDDLMLSMNLCNEFDKRERCPLLQCWTDSLKKEAFKKMLLRAPKVCPRILTGECPVVRWGLSDDY
ncbi:MAG TPA: hypothetical protein VHO70_03940 [Chitinispirillaceae bacterium]|nr:hypothetical protein [Chitinispirillaceae bacterium]